MPKHVITTKTVEMTPPARVDLWLYDVDAADAGRAYHERYHLIAADVGEVTRQAELSWRGEHALANLTIERLGPAPQVLSDNRGHHPRLFQSDESQVWALTRSR